MQRSDLIGQQQWDDVPLPESLTKDHPEPLTINGRSGSTAGLQPASTVAAQADAETGASVRSMSDGLLGLELGSIMEAEPMTREEADAFDATPMDAFFMELQMFSLSNLGAGQQPSDASAAQAGPGNRDAGGHGPPHASKTSLGHCSSVSTGQTSHTSRGSRSFEATDSNRSSFDTVECSGQHSMAGAAMQANQHQDSSPHRRTPQSHLSAPFLDMWPAAGIMGQTLAPAAERSQDRVSSRLQEQGRPAGHPFKAAQRARQAHNSTSLDRPHLQQAAALRAFGLSQVQSTPALRQSAMQLSLGMDLGKGLNLNSWQYGGEGPSVSTVLEAMDCQVSTTGSQSAMPQDSRPGSNAEAEKCQVAQLTSAMIPQPATAFAHANPAPEAERCGSANLMDVPSVPERYNSLPRLKLEPAEDPMQQGDAPMSAPARSAGHLDLAGASPHGLGRSTEGEANQRMESLERYRDKKRRRLFSGAKTIRYEKRKVNADRRPRVKGRFVKQSEIEGMQHGEAKGEATDTASAAAFRQDERTAVRPEFWGM